MKKRNRMIIDTPLDIQMAIKLAAIKNNKTTGEIVKEAIYIVYNKELKEARKALKCQSTLTQKHVDSTAQ